VPVFRGNKGNLLQHWVFCEVLDACRGTVSRIDFIDAHAMAPLADERPKLDATAGLFDCVHEHLPGEGTAYELAWHALAPDACCYPNSAAFLTQVWQADYALVLCESEPATVRALETWRETVAARERCVRLEIVNGDWRDRYREGFAPEGDLTLLSFDPYVVSRTYAVRDAANMYQSDLELVGSATQSIPGRVLMQLSTYSVNGENSQEVVTEAVTSTLQPFGLQLVALVRTDGEMMSLLLGRGIGGGPSLDDLPERFDAWLGRWRSVCR
jgi:hypothetical protein